MRFPRAAVARAAWLGLGVPVAATACHPRATTSPVDAVAEAEPPAVPTEGFVVLPWGTRTYLEPRFGGVSARLGWPGTAPPPWPTTGYVARVVGQRDGFVEIASIVPPATELHCGPLLDGEGSFDVRLYVSPWSLAPVLARELEVTIDGSLLSLRPGALAQPIPDDPQGRSAISAGGIRVRAVVPADAMALAYAVVQPMPIPSERNFQLPEGRPFSFDGWPLELEIGVGQDVAIVSVTPEGHSHVVELMSPCARVYARSEKAPTSWGQSNVEPFVEFGLGAPEPVPEEVLDAAGIEVPIEPDVAVSNPGSVEIGGSFGLIGGTFPGTLPARPEHVFEQGAPVYLSPAGPAAGTLSELRVFSEDAWVAGDRVCFHTLFGSRFDPSLPVCLPAAEDRLRNPAVDVHDFASGVVRPGAVHIVGALDEPEVAGALRRHRSDLRRCLNGAMLGGLRPPDSTAMMNGPWPLGELELGLDVSAEGAVTGVRLLSRPIEPLSACALEAAKQWTMPAPADGEPARITFSVGLEQR